MSKQGFCYVLTVSPATDLAHRRAARSAVNGARRKTVTDAALPDQAPSFDRQGITENDVIDLTPDLNKAALAVLEKYNYGPLFTPPTLRKPTILMPGIAGGASWAGAVFDPETGILYVPSITLPYAATLAKSPVPHADYAGTFAPVESMQGIPLWKPPYGRITAIDLNTGDHRWMVPMGDLARSIPALKQLGLPPLGRPCAVTCS